MSLRPVILYRTVLVGVALAYSIVISPYPYHSPSLRLLWFIAGYGLLSLLPVLWAVLRNASDWFVTVQGIVVLRCTYIVDVLFLLGLAYAGGEGNDLWATFFIPWGMVLLLSSRPAISVQMLDTALGLVLAAMIVLTVWLAISSTPVSPVANALVLWGAFLDGWIILRCLAGERSEWSRNLEEGARELESFQTLAESITTGLALIENDIVVAAPGPSQQLLGVRQGESLSQSVLPPAIINQLKNLSPEEESPLDLECPVVTGDGINRYVGISAFPVRRGDRQLVALVLEARKSSAQREERLRRSNRLASVGQLAAGIAHELGNPIAIIKSCSGYLVDRSAKEDARLEELEIIQREAGRCEALLSRLKSLASGREESTQFDLRSVVQEAVSLVRYQAKGVQLELSLPREPVALFADQSQMVAILVNLLLNAAQSMQGRPREPGIAVTLEAGKKEATLRVTDHGRGMTREEQDKIFDPFYTGRPDGTGLGLSIVYQVIEQIGGTIDVESIPDEGTTFTITLPRADEAQSETGAS